MRGQGEESQWEETESTRQLHDFAQILPVPRKVVREGAGAASAGSSPIEERRAAWHGVLGCEEPS